MEDKDPEYDKARASIADDAFQWAFDKGYRIGFDRGKKVGFSKGKSSTRWWANPLSFVAFWVAFMFGGTVFATALRLAVLGHP